MTTHSFLSTGCAALLARAVAALAVCGTAFAQVVPPPDPEDEPIRLSPFVVSVAEDVGYAAASTLAGSRIRTPVGDVGASISIVTEDFLVDTGSTNLRDVLVYTAGTEVSGVGGNFSNATFANESAGETSLGNQPGTRVRGLASAESTRGYFRTRIPFDAYNSNRLEINRGANAILFGVGSPAGIINYNPATADLVRQSGEFSLAYDRFGSVRANFDFNQPAVNRQVAVRVSVLDDRQKFQQEPAFNHDRRLYAAVTVAPDAFVTKNRALSGTTIRSSLERGEINANNPRSLPPEDRLTFWIQPTAEMIAAGIPARPTHNAALPFSATQGRVSMQNLGRAPVLIYPDATTLIPLDPRGGAVIGRQATINRAASNGTTAAMLSSGRLPDLLRRMNFADAQFFRTPTINDRSMFDFRNNLIDGANKSEDVDIDAVNLSLEQLFLRDRAGFEISFDRQSVEETFLRFLRGSSPIFSVDLNTHLIDGQINPNFSRPFVIAQFPASWNRSRDETKRFTAFGEFDFRNSDSALMRWLGRHVATVLVQDEESYIENRSGLRFYTPDPYPFGNNQNRFNDNGKSIGGLIYIAPPIAETVSSASDLNLPRITGELDMAGGTAGRSFFLRQMAAGSAFQTVPISILEAQRDLSDNSNFASRSLRQIKSKAVNFQSYILKDNLITNVGWRRENIANYAVAAPLATDGQNYRLIDDSRYAFADSSDLETSTTLFSWSAVAKAPRSWFENIPYLSGVNVHYNNSENFAPPVGIRYSPFGDKILPPRGENEDYGFTLDVAEGRAVVRVNWYETSQSLVSNATMTSAVNNVVSQHLNAYNAVRSGFAINRGDGFPVGYVAPPADLLELYNVRIVNGTISSTNPGVASTGDFTAKGLEMELIINPTNRWTIALNATRQESVRTNTGDDAAKLFYNTPLDGGRNLVDTWLDLYTVPLFPEAAINPTPETSGTLANYTQRFIVNAFNNVRLQDGAPAQELRKWRFNAVTNYRFREGWAKGFNIGAAYRWQDRVAIGFPLTDDAAGQRVIDVNRPFFGPMESNFDTWVGYERPIWNDRVRWKIQLNVRNVFRSGDLIPVFTQPTGEQVIFRNSESRLWSFSSKFQF